MIPPRPWAVAVPQGWGEARVYVVDADGRQVFAAALDRDLAEFVAALANAPDELQARVDRIHEAARVDVPGEGKHELAVRIMALARPAQAPLTMETHEGFRGSD